jgi:hypothetical protein
MIFHVQAWMDSVTANPRPCLTNFPVANHKIYHSQYESVTEEYRYYNGCSKTPASRFRCASVDFTTRISFPGPATSTNKATNTIVPSKFCSGQLSRLWKCSDTWMVLHRITKTTSRGFKETENQVQSRKEACHSSYHIYRLQMYSV